MLTTLNYSESIFRLFFTKTHQIAHHTEDYKRGDADVKNEILPAGEPESAILHIPRRTADEYCRKAEAAAQTAPDGRKNPLQSRCRRATHIPVTPQPDNQQSRHFPNRQGNGEPVYDTNIPYNSPAIPSKKYIHQQFFQTCFFRHPTFPICYASLFSLFCINAYAIIPKPKSGESDTKHRCCLTGFHGYSL